MGIRTSTRQYVFRQRSPLALAAVGAVVGLLLLVSLVRDWADNPQPLFAAWVLFGLAFVWSVFVRPAVLLDDEGVTLRNVVRDIQIPWGQVTDLESRWNLKVFAGERGYTAWAISSQVERPKRPASRLPGGFSPGRPDRHAGTAARSQTADPKVTVSMVARSIETARQDHEEAVARGALPAAPDARVRVTWAPLTLAVLLLPVIAVAILTLG